MKTWLKSLLIGIGIWIVLMLIWGVMGIIDAGGPCSWFDSPGMSYKTCFIPSVILTIYAIIPVIIVSIIIGLIIQKVSKKEKK